MKKTCLSLCVATTLFLSGCASYQAASLSALDPECIRKYSEVEGLSIGCKAFSVQDCYDFLDRDVIGKGFQPIQLTFQNTSTHHYVFSSGNMSLPCARPQDVAKKVHTSTVGRVVGYSVGGLFVWPLFIPAIVDGIGSSNANTSLDIDYSTKSRDHLVIAPGSFNKTLVFVPKGQFRPVFDITLVDQESGESKSVTVSAMR